ncbi:MAG: SIR2 family protein [Clostridium sp.]|nr:SIR2 family protein [Clostridium sp.]
MFENEELFKELIKERGFNLFLGAGFSVYAKNFGGEKLPLGNSINEKLIEMYDLDKKRGYDLSHTCQKIRTQNKDALDIVLRDTYMVKDFDETYLKINKLPIKNIFTTNIDNLVEKIYEDKDSEKGYIDSKINGYVEKENLVNLYKLHGSVTHSVNDRLSFTEKELHDLFIIDSKLFNVVSYKIHSLPTIYWGTALGDSNTIQLLCNTQSSCASNNMAKWIVVYPNDEKKDYLIEDYKELGFNIIEADTLELIEYLETMIDSCSSLKGKYVYEKYKKCFPRNFVCKELKKRVPVRPIEDFFHGAEPQISDILSKSIIRTSYYFKVVGKVLENKLVLITGIPGCGKSTLMMQLAFSEEISGRKFWFDNMVKDEAEKIVKLTERDENVTVFLDNLYSNIDAFQILCKSKIRIVVAERALNYEYIKKFLNITMNNIVDISDLNQQDIQNICESMNRKSFEAIELMNSNKSISLLEIVFYAFRSVTVKERIRQYIQLLGEYDHRKIDLLELYALINYTSYCGVPCSMDMLLFYFEQQDVTYEDIYSAVSIMSNIIVDADEISLERGLCSQDMLIMRSRLYSEISITQLPVDCLANVVQKFLENVSPQIIFRYDIFKKRAYDADITNRVFGITEGTLFYEDVLKTNASPYVRHQYSIFLKRKGKIDEAWIQIDKAYTDSNRKIFSIANTHAIIMFQKNIDVVSHNEKEEKQIKEVLNRTFETLEYCIDKDVRMNYHVLIYSRNTMHYYEKFGKDGYCEKYIACACQQLKNVLESDEYIYRKLYDELKNLYIQLRKVECM